MRVCFEGRTQGANNSAKGGRIQQAPPDTSSECEEDEEVNLKAGR